MLKDKAVVVTGAAKGIGRYIAQGFAQQGAKVAIADIDEERMQKTLAELEDFGGEAMAVTTSVRDEEQVRSLMKQVADRFGGIDILINDAGIVPHFQWGSNPRWPAVKDMDESFWLHVLGTNLGGTFLCSKHAVPYMEQRGGGNIVNLYGGGGKTPTGALAYVVSKEAIVIFSEYHAEEVRDANIVVVSISPGGAIATEDAPEEARGRMPGPELAGQRFLLAAEATLEHSGHLLDVKDSKLVIDR
jgi:NAD(P)-dependent dehydrogenase (short-subunit alcohol dehydrogenase family)